METFRVHLSSESLPEESGKLNLPIDEGHFEMDVEHNQIPHRHRLSAEEKYMSIYFLHFEQMLVECPLLPHTLTAPFHSYFHPLQRQFDYP